MPNLLGLTKPQLKHLLAEMGEKPFHGEQIFKWLHQHGVYQFDLMTNLSFKLREKLAELTAIEIPQLAHEQISSDGTVKWMLKLADGNSVETVYIPETTRGTLCVSSQVGCALTCSFCSTAKQGYNRDLTTAEIIGQVWYAVRRLSTQQGRHDKTITNIVMMGMGEPLLNYDNVLAAMQIMRDDSAYGLSKKRVTLSTSGVVPMMQKLKEDSDVSLAVSLHAPNNALRDILVPINKKYPLEQLIPVCQDYFKDRGEPHREVLIEYVMLKDVNDSIQQAKELISLLKEGISPNKNAVKKSLPAKINLIPFNPFPGSGYECSSEKQIEIFQNLLIRAGINTRRRKTRGQDIDAACGQLVGRIQDITQRQKKYYAGLNTLKIPIVQK